MMKIFRGRLVHSVGWEDPIEVTDDAVIGYQGNDGTILFVEKASEIERLSKKFKFSVDTITTLSDREFLMPGLVDTHVHAPQYVNSGRGYDERLLDWLDKYTFPTESKFRELEYASQVYTKAVKRLLQNGTTTASYFATIHLEATKELCRVIDKLGQRALVGKVNMDQNSPDFYVEGTQESLENTRKFIEFVSEMKNPRIGPIVTPRFAISCSDDLLAGLGKLAREYDIPVQSHLCEQLDEIKMTKGRCKNTADIFDKADMLTNKSLMAHCIYLEEEELDILQTKGVGICHCPASNFNLRSGLFDSRKILEKGIKVGLGTDISGGHSPSVFSAMRSAIDTSRAHCFNMKEFRKGDVSVCEKAISHHHAFYMATLGGAKVLSMDDKIGNFEVGKQFDALLINIDAPCPSNPVFDVFEPAKFEDILSMFLYLGDDRNISKVYVAGQEVKV